ncbi:MAG: hypothetical protein HYZ45_01130 [Burkholderiales bacterium]|nr:hypothetical protein [Burkholderiales bacterium]
MADLKIGALFSDRDYLERGYNRVVGQDVNWQWNQYISIRAHWLHSQTTARANSQGELERQQELHGSAQRIEYMFRSKRWEGTFYSERVSPDFRADNGFFGQVGYLTEFAQLTHKLGRLGFLNELNIIVSNQDSRDWQGNILRHGMRPALKLELGRDTSVNLEMASNEQQRVVSGGQLHALSFVSLLINSAPSNWLPQASARLNVGDKIDPSVDQKVKGNTLELKLAMKPQRQFDLKVYWLKEWLKNSYALQNTDNHWQRTSDSALQMQANWEIDPSLNLRVVLSRGKATRNPALYEHNLELMAFDDSLSNAFSIKKSLTSAFDVTLGVSRARLQTGKNDAYLRFQWRLE